MLHPCGREAVPMVDMEQRDIVIDTYNHAADNADLIHRVQEGHKQLQYSPWEKVSDLTPMAQPHYLAIRPRQQLGAPTVGGLEISSSLADISTRHRTSRVLRGKDCRERQKRTCARCALHHGTNGWRCNGRKGGRSGGQKACEFFNADGFPTALDQHDSI